MTYKEATSAEIEPYSLSDESIEKSILDAQSHFNTSFGVEDDYDTSNKTTIALAAMLCLNRVRELTSENIGGISQAYDVKKIDARIKALARANGLSPDLVLSDSDTEQVVSYAPVW